MNERVSEFLRRASKEPVRLTVRELLGIWGFTSRNSFETVGQIESALSGAGLRCEPAFTEGGLDSLVLVGRPSEEPEVPSTSEQADDALKDEPLRLPPVAPLIGSIPSATRSVMSVHPEQTLEYAQGLMIANDYSQLPVLIGDRELKGAVSWRSIARARVAKPTITLGDVIDPHPPVVHASDKLLDAVTTIYDTDFVFVRGDDDRICGIITTADLSTQFRDLTAPFFQIGEIEGLLRSRIQRVFSMNEIRLAVKAAKLESVEDMTFYQYQLLLGDSDRWRKLHCGVDRGMFIDYLNKTRLVRNKIMHFDQENLTPDERDQVEQCLNCVRAVVPAP
jgi:CBS domain-containing protein